MVETIGKKLNQARLAKGLSLDEAAHATRVRPEKLLALENDDYSRFGSNAYAKGFLQLYGRYLGVDVSNHLSLLETPRQVSVSDYQYLNNAPKTEPSRVHLQRYDQRPSVVPLLMALGMIIIGAVTMVGYWVNINMQRLELTDAQKPAAPQAVAPASVETPAPTPAQANPATASDQSNLAPVSNPIPVTNTGAVQSSGATVPLPAMRATGVSVNTPGAAPSAPGSAINELVVEPLKKTWVTIRRDNSTSAPIFEDYVYPGVRPLTLRGDTFYVEVRDQDAVQIRKNGSPIAYQAPGISIQ